jgi:hypothetical protein
MQILPLIDCWLIKQPYIRRCVTSVLAGDREERVNLLAGRIKALYLDAYKDSRVRKFLDQYGFRYFNGRTLEPASESTMSLPSVLLE